jgi:3-ketosteroid 9alpha-monooxygenase subunit B
VLDLLPPAGTFSPRSLDTDFLLFTAGSGITPVMSILKSALAAGRGRVVLVYANRDERSVIFGSDLRRLVAAAAGRLIVVHWLDSLLGLPTAAGIAALARPYNSYEAFICGPDRYLATVREALGLLGVPSLRVHVERFLSLSENARRAHRRRARRAVLVPPGICGACACQLTGGEVEMAHNEVLEDADLADGYILACQAVPLTAEVSITY